MEGGWGPVRAMLACGLLLRRGLPALIFRYHRSQEMRDRKKAQPGGQWFLLFLRGLEAASGLTPFPLDQAWVLVRTLLLLLLGPQSKSQRTFGLRAVGGPVAQHLHG